MFDIGWGEITLIGVVALVVIGPKELPGVLRTVGQTVTKLRRMAGEFQSQFQEALREAEMDDVGKTMSDLNRGFNPIQTVRDEIKNAVEGTSAATPAIAAPASTSSSAEPAPSEPPPTIVPAPPVAEPAPSLSESPPVTTDTIKAALAAARVGTASPVAAAGPGEPQTRAATPGHPENA
jgi:sec-independent protein translocase protein TatB